MDSYSDHARAAATWFPFTDDSLRVFTPCTSLTDTVSVSGIGADLSQVLYWLGKQVKECYRVDLYPGDTMLIPSGWIHAVWTPEDSLVIGGNFLTRIHYGMQIKILEIEKNTKVATQFRYPFFQKIMWLTAIKYLEEDPIPGPVQELLQSGEQFKRSTPIYCEPEKFGHNSHLGAQNYNKRYYSKHELEGLAIC